VTGLRIGSQGREKVVVADAYVAALDVPGAKRLLPSAWRSYPLFDNIHKLVGVPVITVQLRYNGWVTEMRDSARVRGRLGRGWTRQRLARSSHEP
jgi:zeta-carotene desaturase